MEKHPRRCKRIAPTKMDVPKSTPPKKSSPGKKMDEKVAISNKENIKRNLAEEIADSLHQDVFQDESNSHTMAAIENYFLQGKSAAERMNKGRPTRKNKIKEPTNDDDSDEELCKSFEKCNLSKLRDYINERNESHQFNKILTKIDEQDMAKWTLFLASGFNILIHGIGSKRDILDTFCKSELNEFTWIRIDARKEDVNPKTVLASINEKMRLNVQNKGISTTEWAKKIRKSISRNGKQLIILIDNLESPHWRNDQSVVCALLEDPRSVKMVATVDHIYSTLMWNSRQIDVLNFVHLYINTFKMPLHEIINGESRLLGLDAKSNQSSHTMASLDVFWAALASNSQKLLQLFFSVYFETKKPVNFWDFFNVAKDEFLVSSDASLRTQLVEFKDHRILKWTRSDDGNDQVSGIVDQKLMTEFLKSKGMPIDSQEE